MKTFKKCLCYVLVLMSLLTMVSVAQVNHTHAASASDYISQSYASSLSVKTTKTVSLMSMPTTASGSAAKYTLPADTVLTVKALHKNTDGKYFYEVLYYNLTLYIDATATTMLDHLTGDVTITNEFSPSSLTYGAGFPIRGDIKSSLNIIRKVTASMYNGTDITRKPAITSSDTVNGKSYSLASSTVDKNLIFSDLPRGSYSYVVSAEALSYYIDSSGSLKTYVTTVILENQICAVTNGSNPNPVLYNGIDVSVWNGNIDWAQVKSQTDFAIIRASWEETADTKFKTNADGCVNNGIPFGVYVYSYAENAAEAIGEAEYVLSLVDGYDMDLPIFFDFEDECQMNLGAAKQQEIVKAFCDTIYAGGRQPGLYTYVWLLRSVFTDSYYNTIPIWTAEINGSSYTSYKGGLWLWQWSWVGRFNGMSGDVDCNKMYVDLPDKNKSDTSYLSKCTYYPSNFNGTVNQEYNMRQYPSTDYSVLATIPANTKVQVTGLYKNSYGNLWYQIVYNGTTGYMGAESINVNEFLYNDIAVTDPKMASNLAVGKGFYIQGVLSSVYNKLVTVNAKIYAGENTLGTPTLKSSASVGKKDYNLYKSTVDYNLNFGLLSEGYYTYEISADVKNYYYNNGSLAYKSENVVVWKAPFTVGSASITPPESNVCIHNIETQEGKVPTCTEAGYTMSSKCTLCGEVISKKETIPALGHSYSSKLVEATCITSAHYHYTCANCSSEYKEYPENEWLETRPEGYDDNKIETKTQYRTSTYKEIKNYETNISYGTQIKKEWEDAGNTTITYAKSWPSGFLTSNSLYSKYNITPKTNSETETIKYEIVSAEKAANAWLYYHWCIGTYTGGPINRATSAVKTDRYSAFHAYYDTKNPVDLDDGRADDGSVPNGNASACTDSYWYYNVPLYTQTYKTYKALYTHATWTDWTEWSDTPATATDTLRVETRQLYRVKNLGDHRFSRGRCLVCDYVCSHEWENGKCNLCLMSCMHRWSNGECTICKQPCVHSWQNGVCTNCSFVCVHEWCEGICDYCGTGCAHIWVEDICDICGHLCYPHAYDNGKCTFCSTPCPGHIWSDDTCEICFMTCIHKWVDGVCENCSTVCEHSYKNGSCLYCGDECDHNFVNSKCTICNYICKHSYIDGVCTDCLAVCTHNWHNGVCTGCNMKCAHQWNEGVCGNCNMNCPHTFKNGICTSCLFECTHVWNNGVCKVCNTVCTHHWEEGECTVCSKKCKHAWYDEKCQICHIPCSHNFEDSVCTLCLKECTHSWKLGTCVVCEKNCEHDFADGYCKLCLCDCDHSFENAICIECGISCNPHNFKDGKCTICDTEEPEYYLVGYINGKDYGVGIDKENIGTYKFEDGKLVVTFTQDSFVAIKTDDNSLLYMTNGYLGDKVNTAILYNAELLGDKADKLFVPKGREITFTLTDNKDGSYTFSYVAAVCEHINHDINGVCTACGILVEHNFQNGGCTVCEKPCEHNFVKGTCLICTAQCEHNWVDDTCTICMYPCTHNFIDGECTTCHKPCEHSWIDGGCEYCGLNCNHKFTNGVCDICSYICYHSYVDGICTECFKECDHIWRDGTCKYCLLVCDHNYDEGVCTKCAYACQHTYSKDKCTTCQIAKYYLVGYINKEAVGFNEDYDNLGHFPLTDGSVTVNVKYDSYFFVKSSDQKNWYMATEDASGMFALLENTKLGNAGEMIFIPGGVTAEFTVYSGKNDTVGFVYTIESCIHKLHNSEGICLACEEEAEHTYSHGVCEVCMVPKPEQDMYLFGIINGEEYGYNYDADNIGEYLFVDKTLTVNFEEDSFVGIKSKDNRDWYMTNGKPPEDLESAVLSNTRDGIDADLFFIPGGTEVVITIINNGNDTFTISYKSAEIPDCTLKVKYTELLTEGEFRYKVNFTASGADSLNAEEIGLVLFDRNVAEPTIENAATIISGAAVEGNYLVIKTDPIKAQYLVDTINFSVYAKFSDGTYIYSDVVSYSAVRYAHSVINSKYSAKADKAKMVSLLNYIAAAQKYNGYKTESLANAGLTQ